MNHKKYFFCKNFLAIFSATFLFSNFSQAGESVFGYVYTTDLAPKGTYEFEQKIEDKHGQAHGTYNNIKMQSELEYGVTNNFQAALYINYSNINAKNNSVNSTTEGLDIPMNHDPYKSYHAFRYDGMQAEFIYRVLSPYTDSIGLAFYLEPAIGPRERELEGRIILHKNFLDDQLITAMNVTVAYEQEKMSAMFEAAPEKNNPSWEKMAMIDLTAGVSYRFKPNWFAGLEYRNHNEFGGSWRISRGKQEHTAHFLGPVIHYGAKKFFATLGFRYQIKANSFGEQKSQSYNGKIYGDEHATFDGIRFIFGYPFSF